MKFRAAEGRDATPSPKRSTSKGVPLPAGVLKKICGVVLVFFLGAVRPMWTSLLRISLVYIIRSTPYNKEYLVQQCTTVFGISNNIARR